MNERFKDSEFGLLSMKEINLKFAFFPPRTLIIPFGRTVRRDLIEFVKTRFLRNRNISSVFFSKVTVP